MFSQSHEGFSELEYSQMIYLLVGFLSSIDIKGKVAPVNPKKLSAVFKCLATSSHCIL